MKFDWMKGSFGISAHWTSHSVCPDGSHLPYEEAVNRFNVDDFANSLSNVGAKHCIFTLTHAEQRLALPHPILEKLYPGSTTQRDLIGEIINALQKRNIHFIAYYNHSCNGNDNIPWKKFSGYDAGINGNLDQFADNICNIVEFISKRYGSGISGWWFDSGYSVDLRGPINTVSTDLGNWLFPWKKLTAAARSGNPDSAITVNAGIGSHFRYTDDIDYYAGETVQFDEPFTPDPLPTIQDHRWTCADHTAWVFHKRVAQGGFVPLRWGPDKTREFVKIHQTQGRMVTFNFLIDQLGHFNPHLLDLIK